MTLLSGAQIRILAQELDLHPAKSLGQNFVVDANTIRRIVGVAGLPSGSDVLEIGPGLGSLTLGLLEAGHSVTAVELDGRLAERLPITVAELAPAAAGRLRVIHQDGAALTADQATPGALVANLPYNVAVPVLLHCLVTFPTLRRCLIMVQLEVAERLCADPGSRTYGSPSVKVRWFGTPTRVGTVSPRVFWPIPRVDSGLVAITAHVSPQVEVSREQVFGTVDMLFNQRRKMLRSILSNHYGPGVAADILRQSGVEGQLRPERLELADFIRLSEASARIANRLE